MKRSFKVSVVAAALALCGVAAQAAEKVTIQPVSYTHLDVYKRQGHAGGLCHGHGAGRGAGRADRAFAHAGACLLYTSRCV